MGILRWSCLVSFPLLAALPLLPITGAAQQQDDLAKKLRELDGRILTADKDQAKAAANMVWDDLRQRLKQANKKSTTEWRGLKSVADWEKYRDAKIEALRQSLGKFPPVPKEVDVHVTRTLAGDGYQIKNIAFESRPGLLVTANLYLPAKAAKPMPGILILHSHHNPKTQGELQDMGMLWARLGCAVLVMDQLGHGERRQHPFVTDKDYPKAFKPGRQDYYFRYNVNQQLNIVGDSLMGWMAWDIWRGVDVLLDQQVIDKSAIILMGSVAGGGDPCAVAAALDKRITAAVPFNFGGPQPESVFPLPADADDAFNYAGGGSWESTRNLKHSARDGFLPWVIVGSIAPRPLIYAHEFAWDRDRDPVWKRLQQIYQWYKTPDSLSFAHGKGKVTGPGGPDNTHCNNIGAVHRQHIYPGLSKWFGIPIPKEENQLRKKSEELQCLTPGLHKKNYDVHSHAFELALHQIKNARPDFGKTTIAQRQEKMRKDWISLLGGIDPEIKSKSAKVTATSKVEDIKIEKVVLNTDRDIQVPALLLIPPAPNKKALPVVVAVAQQGHAGFLKHRSELLAELLKKGVAVCLPDVRGSGETQMSSSRSRTSSATSLSATELMLGGTMLGNQCRDLLAVVNYLRTRPEFNDDRIALWGDSFAPVNAKDAKLDVPLDVDLPEHAEPMGTNLALLGALFDTRIRAVHARGGLGSYLTALGSPFYYLPHDAVVPGAATAGDVCDLAGALAPRPLWLQGMVNGVNQSFKLEGKKDWRPQDDPMPAFFPAEFAYKAAKAENALRLVDDPALEKTNAAVWLVQQLTE